MEVFHSISYNRTAVIACISWSGFINQFLSWKVFVPLGRLTYAVYLIHQNYLFVYHSYLRKPYYYTRTSHTEHYFGTLLMVFLMAYGVCITVELPLLNLERLLIKPSSISKLNNFWDSLVTDVNCLIHLSERRTVQDVESRPKTISTGTALSGEEIVSSMWHQLCDTTIIPLRL